MSRPIKFRYWNKRQKFWNDSEHLLLTNDGEVLSMIYEEGENYRNVSLDYEIAQFTGLTDKNGKEIYSGDIVKNGVSGSWIVEMCVGGFELFCVFGPHKGRTFDFSALNRYAEVVGNIYENPQ